MTNPLYRLRPRVTDMHDGSFRPKVIVDDGAEGGIKFGVPVAKAAKRARASCGGSSRRLGRRLVRGRSAARCQTGGDY